jgi:hypothetical protein
LEFEAVIAMGRDIILMIGVIPLLLTLLPMFSAG